jgi:hypothetical protein
MVSQRDKIAESGVAFENEKTRSQSTALEETKRRNSIVINYRKSIANSFATQLAQSTQSPSSLLGGQNKTGSISAAGPAIFPTGNVFINRRP